MCFSYGSQLAYADENLKDLKRSLRFAYNITPCDYENVEIAFVTTNSIHINTKQKDRNVFFMLILLYL